MNKYIIFVVIFGVASAGTIHQQEAAAPVAVEYGVPAEAPVAYQENPNVSPIVKETPAQNYGKSIPAAAIRNLEKVEVTKTITPVVTKTTTHQTHSEPALSVGHVQGYTQTTVGEPKFAEVQYNTVYTQYLNPTVGVNGPVTYSGPAVSPGVAHNEGVAYSPVAVAAQYAVPVAKAHPQYAHAAPAQYAHAAPVQYAHAAPVQYAHAAPPQYAHAAPPQYAYAPAPAQFAYAQVPHVKEVVQAEAVPAAVPSFLGSLYSVSPAYSSFGAQLPVAKAFAAPAPVVKTAAPVENVAYAAGPAAVPGAITDVNALLANSGYQGFFQ